MSPLNSTAVTAATVPPYRRHPQRITITLSHATYQALVARSDDEGRSLSNLSAYLLERAIA